MVATRSQATDEVATNSATVTAHMNKDHKDSLAYLVTHHADLPKLVPANQVEMVSIDSTKITVKYPGQGGNGKKTIDVPFYPHISSYATVRSRVVELCAMSERVVKARKTIVIYKAPKFAILVTAIAVGVYAALRSEHFASHPLVTALPSDWLLQWNTLRNVTLGGRAKMDAFMYNIARIHVAEAAAMVAFSLFRGASLHTALKWAATTFFVGFPSWLAFLKVNSNSAIARRAIYGYGVTKRKD